MLKALVDDHPVGAGLAPFVLDFLVGSHERRVFCSAEAALVQLRHFDARLAASWTLLLDSHAETAATSAAPYSATPPAAAPAGAVPAAAVLAAAEPKAPIAAAAAAAKPPPSLAGICFGDFDPRHAAAAEPLSSRNVRAAVLAGCRRRLLGCRAASLGALREGFTQQLDLQLQLAPLSHAQLRQMCQGRPSLSLAELLDCFDWSD